MSSSATTWPPKVTSKLAILCVSAVHKNPSPCVASFQWLRRAASPTSSTPSLVSPTSILPNAAVINDEFAPNRIGLVFPESPDEAALDQLASEVEALLPGVRSTDIYDFLERYEVVSQYLGDFVVVMGLGALLIGGVGIMNTHARPGPPAHKRDRRGQNLRLAWPPGRRPIPHRRANSGLHRQPLGHSSSASVSVSSSTNTARSPCVRR